MNLRILNTNSQPFLVVVSDVQKKCGLSDKEKNVINIQYDGVNDVNKISAAFGFSYHRQMMQNAKKSFLIHPLSYSNK